MTELEIGKRYIIQTKRGQVVKYLSHIDQYKNYFFVEKEHDIGRLFAPRGACHNPKNVIGVYK